MLGGKFGLSPIDVCEELILQPHTPKGSDIGKQRVPKAKVACIRHGINRALYHHEVMPDFPAAKIPSPFFNASVHLAMRNFVAQRERIDADLHNMAHD